MSDAEVEEARANGNPFFNITESTQNGFRAEVENASIKKAGDTLSLLDKNGNESLVLESHVYLKNGSAVKVNYETTGNTIKGTFESQCQRIKSLFVVPVAPPNAVRLVALQVLHPVSVLLRVALPELCLRLQLDRWDR